MKSSPAIWHLLYNVKSMVKISSIFVAFLENMDFMKVARHNFLATLHANSAI